MRKIKFRAWDKKSKELREVTSIIYTNKSFDYMDYKTFNEIKLIYLKGRDIIDDKDIQISRKKSECELLQFTGLFDKQGIEIYEGDIVIVTEEEEDSCMGREFSHKGIVSYGNSLKLSGHVPQYPSSFCLISKSFYREQALLFNDRWEYEVIGNIYENPELLVCRDFKK